MPEKYKSPKEFLEQLKVEFSKPIQPGSTISEEFETITRNQLSEMGYIESLDELRLYDPVIEQLVNTIYANIPSQISKRIQSSVAIGPLNTGEVNAMCVKSLDNKYAVLINYGLMTLFHKFYKLQLAKSNPKSVTFCNRKNAEELTSNDLETYARELIENYKKYRVPYGALIKLDMQYQSSIAITQWAMVSISEIFTICHELGHFLNGDLDREENFSLFHRGGDKALKQFNELSYLMEFNADITGYTLFEPSVIEGLGIKDKRFIISTLIIFFDILYKLSGKNSPSHPNPLSRALSICEHFYGKELAEAVAQSYNHDWDNFHTIFSKPIDLNQQGVNYYNRGKSYARLTEYDKAVADFSKAIDLDPQNADYYDIRGHAYARLTEYDKAVADFSKAIDLDPQKADHYASRGATYVELKEYDKAVADFGKAIGLDPQKADYYTGRGAAYVDLKEYDKALADYTQAIERSPRDAKLWSNRGLLRYNTQRYEEAISDFSAAIEKNPKRARYYSHRGLTLYRYGRPDQAQSDFTHALGLEMDSNVFTDLAARSLLAENLTESIAYLRKAFELDPIWTRESLENDGDFDSIRSTLDFQALLREFPPSLQPHLTKG